MKSMLAMLGLGLMAGCAASSPADGPSEGASAIITGEQDGPATGFPESVQVLQDNGVDYCSGVLVGPRVVVTAAHCASGSVYTIKAPLAPGKPTVTAKLSAKLTTKPNDPANDDLAVLRLDTPIALAQYGIPTDIGIQADRGDTFEAIAVGRQAEARDAALVQSKPMTVRTAADQGYPSGLRTTTYYSSGGDSGGPLFLVEGGQPTHKVVGVERQPDPSANTDFFTRIDETSLVAIARAGQ